MIFNRQKGFFLRQVSWARNLCGLFKNRSDLSNNWKNYDFYEEDSMWWGGGRREDENKEEEKEEEERQVGVGELDGGKEMLFGCVVWVWYELLRYGRLKH